MQRPKNGQDLGTTAKKAFASDHQNCNGLWYRIILNYCALQVLRFGLGQQELDSTTPWSSSPTSHCSLSSMASSLCIPPEAPEWGCGWKAPGWILLPQWPWQWQLSGLSECKFLKLKGQSNFICGLFYK